MIPTLTNEQRQAIQENGGTPIYIIDTETNKKYVLLSAEQFEKLKADEDKQI